jgi:DoxX-like family
MERPLLMKRIDIGVRAKTIFYWTTTSLIALETFAEGVIDLTHGRAGVVSGPFVTQVVTNLGYPVYILTILGIFKIPGAITLVVPGFLRLKEWAYAGIVFELSGAVASNAACGNRRDLIAPLSFLCLAFASWALRPPSRILGAPFLADGH